MLVKHALDFRRSDVFPAAQYHVLGAVHDEDVALFINGRKVAGMKPAVADGLGGRFRLVPVAGHDHVARHHHFSDFGRVTPNVFPIHIHDAHLRPRHRITGARLVGDADILRLARRKRLWVRSDDDGRGFREPVSAQSRCARDFPLDFADEGGARRRAAQHHFAQARQVVSAKGRIVEHGDEHGGNAVQPRDALALDELHD